jgi:hypothetical protein
VSQVGQKDPRVSAVVAWDNLATVAGAPLRVPALGINSEYFLNPQPTNSPPDPHLKDAAFRQLRAAGVDTMQVALRESTHLEYSYVPWILPASRLGERVAFYYTLAWFDRYLRNRPDGLRRLTATRFDRSADVHSIGAGTYDGNNVPYRIAGGRVVDRLSFLYQSAYWLDHGAVRCDNWRAGCK